MTKAPRFVLAYDAACGPCSRFKAAVDVLDARERLRFVPLEEADRSGLLAGIAESSRYASFHLLRPEPGGVATTETWSGSEALLPLMRLLSPRGGAVSRLVEGAPGSIAAAAFVYSTLSRLHRACPATVVGGPSSPIAPASKILR